MSARHVIDALYAYVVAVVYAASCWSHGPCYNETTRCGNIKYSSLIRYSSLFNTSAFRGSWNNHIINMLPWHSFQLRVWKPITNVNFQAFNLNFPFKIQKTGDTYAMAYGWFMFGIQWTNEKWCMPTFPQICLLGNRILNSMTWLLGDRLILRSNLTAWWIPYFFPDVRLVNEQRPGSRWHLHQ